MNAVAVCQLLVIEMLCEKIGFELHLHLPLSETSRSQAPQVSECNTEH